jgi:hypothetical protein
MYQGVQMAGVLEVSEMGHERRPFKWRRPDNFRYAPGSDRGRVAAQYVAKGQKRSILPFTR